MLFWTSPTPAPFRTPTVPPTEPDMGMWVTQGVQCVVLRHPFLGMWCAYVQVSDTEQDDGPLLERLWEASHGGLTFGPDNFPSPSLAELRHFCAKEVRQVFSQPGSLWVGFDCGHAHDRAPGAEYYFQQIAGRERYRLPEAEYCTLEHVREHLDAMVDILADHRALSARRRS